MGIVRRLDRLVRPPGHVPLGTPRQQAHLARWWRWYGVAALALLPATVVVTVAGLADPGFLATPAAVFALYALGGWRVTHPPRDP